MRPHTHLSRCLQLGLQVYTKPLFCLLYAVLRDLVPNRNTYVKQQQHTVFRFCYSSILDGGVEQQWLKQLPKTVKWLNVVIFQSRKGSPLSWNNSRGLNKYYVMFPDLQPHGHSQGGTRLKIVPTVTCGWGGHTVLPILLITFKY